MAYPTLNQNEVISALYNQIISQQVFADNIKGNVGALANKYRVDGTLYGDTKLYTATDALESYEWGADAEAGDLLKVNRGPEPETQAITLDKFRQINVTVDNYLTKRAFANEGTFSDFKSVVLGWVGDTKKVYEGTMVNVFVGTVKSASNVNTIEVGETGAEIANGLADLFTDLTDVSRDYNDYKFLRGYNAEDFDIIWNAAYVNKVKNIDLPVIFHDEALKSVFNGTKLNKRYFGNIGASGTVTFAQSQAGLVRSLLEQDVIDDDNNVFHLFPGDVVPTGVSYNSSNAYVVDDTIVAKVVHKNAIKYMSAFEVATTFFNARSLTENHYLTFGYSDPTYLKNYPVITVKTKA